MTNQQIGRPSIGPRVFSTVPVEVRDALRVLAKQSGVTFSTYVRNLILASPEVMSEAERQKKAHAVTL